MQANKLCILATGSTVVQHVANIHTQATRRMQATLCQLHSVASPHAAPAAKQQGMVNQSHAPQATMLAASGASACIHTGIGGT
jgi:hypothetical protein